MLKNIIEKNTQVFDLIKYIFIEDFLLTISPSIETSIKNSVNSNMHFAEGRIASGYGYMELYEEDLIYCINGCKQTRMDFLTTFHRILLNRVYQNVLVTIFSAVCEYYIRIAMQDMRKYISDNQDVIALILQLANRIQNDSEYVNTIMSLDRSTLEESDAYGLVKKEIQSLIQKIITDEVYNFKIYFEIFINKYFDTIQYLFITCREGCIADKAINEFALESIEEAENELKILPDFSLNKSELINRFVELAATENGQIDYTPEDYEKEYSELSDDSNETFRRIVEKYKQGIITKKSYKIRENDTGYSYEKIFGDILPGTRSIIIDDSYIEKDHQVENLIRFCSIARKFCSPEKIKLITKECNRQRIEKKLKEFKDNLKSHQIEFEVEFSSTIHDRRIELDNGWTIILGRGLDIYKHAGVGINWRL